MHVTWVDGFYLILARFQSIKRGREVSKVFGWPAVEGKYLPGSWTLPASDDGIVFGLPSGLLLFQFQLFSGYVHATVLPDHVGRPPL
jgi:hypothetical protein